tara:strand:+ start:1435 stop:3387 length:1953 start_codon:yes stop_codon:yes gene_type:complete
MDLRFGKIENNFSILEMNYEYNGEIDWKTFDSDQKKYSKKVVNLKQKDFEHGTLRITQPCLIKLQENIFFNPNRPEKWIDSEGNLTSNFNQAVKIDPRRKLDWWPNLIEKPVLNKTYFQKEVRHAYRLGFFSAIALETKDIIFDLNNFTIQQHPEHTLQQRFFTTVELADQPFVPRQGPGNFGNILKSATNVMIKNGTFGLSSHHGIHGNNNNTIVLKNLQFIDNEVSNIAINGGKHIYLSNINVIRNRHDIPVLGTYSAGRFLKLFMEGLKDAVENPHLEYIKSKEILLNELDKTFNAIFFKNESVPELFKNKSGLIDGNYYGIIINPTGVAINAPLKDRNNSKSKESYDIYFSSVYVNNIRTNINEILALKNSSNKILIAPAGGVFQFMECSKVIDDKYFYQGNALSDIQIELVQLLKDNDGLQSFLGGFNIDEGILIWKRNKDSYFKHDFNNLIGNNELENYNYEIVANGDSMFHVNKGTFGIKIDGLNSSFLENINITNIFSEGKKGSLLAGNYQKSHPKQDHLDGYQGCFLYGLSLNASEDINVNNININNLESKNGSSYAIKVSGESNKITLSETVINNITSCQIPFNHSDSFWPNLPTNSRGIYISENCNVSSKLLIIDNIKDTPKCLHPSKMELYSDLKLLP